MNEHFIEFYSQKCVYCGEHQPTEGTPCHRNLSFPVVARKPHSLVSYLDPEGIRVIDSDQTYHFELLKNKNHSTPDALWICTISRTIWVKKEEFV